MASYGSIPCVGCLCLEALAGWLEGVGGLDAVPEEHCPETTLVGKLVLEWVWAGGCPLGVLCPRLCWWHG